MFFRAILEAKAKLYDNMTKGDYIPDSEDAQVCIFRFFLLLLFMRGFC